MVTLNDFVPNQFRECANFIETTTNFTERVTGTTKLLCSGIKTSSQSTQLTSEK